MVRKHKTERFLPQPLTKEEWIRHHLETADAVVYSVEEFLKAAGNLPKESEIFFFDGVIPYPNSRKMLDETDARIKQLLGEYANRKMEYILGLRKKIPAM